MVTKLQKWGNSYGVRLPKKYISKLDLEEQSEFDIRAKDNQLILTLKKRKEESLDDLVSKINKDNIHTPTDWGEDVGAEGWYE